MLSRLSGVRIKIDRAKKHLADLDAAIRAFEASRPYQVIPNVEAQTGYETYQFRMMAAIPDEWAAILGDCIHNLRCALDHLAVELVRANGGTPGNYTAFPIGSDVANFESSAIKRIDGASALAIKMVRKLKPYHGGHETIYRLHQIDIADKHSLLIPVAITHPYPPDRAGVGSGAGSPLPPHACAVTASESVKGCGHCGSSCAKRKSTR